MFTKIGSSKINIFIVINSLVFFLVAYYFVVLSSNLFSIILAKSVGFDVKLFYNGFLLSGKKWDNDKIILIYFFGNAISLAMAIFFERLYRIQRKYPKERNIFFLWVYIISITWFLGNIIVGVIFNFGIGTGFRAIGLPFFFRLLLAMAAISLLLYLGYKAQKHVRVSANIYFSALTTPKIGYYFTNQILLPVVLGIIIIILLKLPDIGFYHYVDLYILLSIGFFVAGLFFRYSSLNPIFFKMHNPGNTNLIKSKPKLSFIPIVILILVLAIIRIGLMDGMFI